MLTVQKVSVSQKMTLRSDPQKIIPMHAQRELYTLSHTREQETDPHTHTT